MNIICKIYPWVLSFHLSILKGQNQCPTCMYAGVSEKIKCVGSFVRHYSHLEHDQIICFQLKPFYRVYWLRTPWLLSVVWQGVAMSNTWPLSLLTFIWPLGMFFNSWHVMWKWHDDWPCKIHAKYYRLGKLWSTCVIHVHNHDSSHIISTWPPDSKLCSGQY